ncbi:YitT family protein [Mycoplasma sp. 21DD0573]|uniref:YitT family protein n=1 Tax=unclassified Mycoplasma TaxID=2683645 RepID=UPI002B1E7CD5|nr:YitT family protein [Mycoplasma sp. 21DD0573]MEA4276344.1 YitT family protein [Mycoplasma sp. 21DD0573]
MKNKDNFANENCNKTTTPKSSWITNYFKFKSKKIDLINKASMNLDANNSAVIINPADIKKEEEKLKYKMAKYLNNSKQSKLTFKTFWVKYWLKLVLTFVSALIFNFGIHIFLSKADTIPSGITGIPTILQYLFPILKNYFALIYFACNLPLFIIFWRKVKFSFIGLTLFFMLCLQLTNFIFTEEHVHSFLFEKINLVPIDYDNYNVSIKDSKAIVEVASTPGQANLKELIDFKLNPSAFSAEKAAEFEKYAQYSIEQLTQLAWYSDGISWGVLLYGCLGAVFIGTGIAISWKAGGSTGGTDIIAYYFSTKHKKSVSLILVIVGFVTAVTFVLIYGFVRPNPNGELFGMRELSTFSYLIVTNLVVGMLYPKYKKVNLTIISSNPERIIAYFKLINYWHSYRIERFKSGYTGKTAIKIETTILLLEEKNLIADLKIIDPTVWVSCSKVAKVSGNFNTNYVEQ